MANNYSRINSVGSYSGLNNQGSTSGGKESGTDLGTDLKTFKNLLNQDRRSGEEEKQLAEISKKLDELGILNKTIKEANKENGKDNKKAIKLAEKSSKTEEEQLKETKENRNFLKGQLSNLLSSGFKALTSGIDKAISTYSNYAIQVNTAMQGSTKSYVKAVESLNDAIGSTGLAKMSDVLSQMNNLTSRGIIANVEQKAFLASIKDGIVSSFDVADSTMLRLIKLQGEESTTNRLVMQASLRDYLNAQYENSQYIYENYKTVSDSLLEATSLLTSQLSLSLESTVQKWMGSLSSVGMSANAINSLSAAIGALGSGNLSAMSSSGVQTLLMMGASRAGLSYSDMLTGGVSAENAEALMAGMVRYLGSLTGNNVILSEYAKIFGISVSDIVAARNATEELSSIMGSQIAYSENKLGDYLQTYNETLNEVPSVLYDALMDNLFFGMGVNVASNRLSYGTYKVGGMLSNIGSEISKAGEIVVSTAGTIMNVAGIAAQLAAATGITSGKGIKGVAKSITSLTDSFKNLFASPDSLAAFNALGGLNIIGSSFEGGEGSLVRRGAGVFKETSQGQYGEPIETSIDFDESALEEAEAARTANDIYEFLSDDVVTITPYVGGENDTLSLIANYNKITAVSTSGIYDVINKIISGEIQLRFNSGEPTVGFGEEFPPLS